MTDTADAIRRLQEFADGLPSMPWQGADLDEPEGARYVTISETLALMVAADIKIVLRALEDAADVEAARIALAEPGESISYDEARRELYRYAEVEGELYCVQCGAERGGVHGSNCVVNSPGTGE